jgi:hypothetical protein
MRTLKKVLPIAGLAALVALQAATAWNARLCWRAKALAQNPGEKIRLLRRADAVFPWSSAVPFELGQSYFEQGIEAMGDPETRDALFQNAVASYLRSLRLNPGSAAAHLGLGQALLYAGYAGLPTPLPYFDEYKRAAELTGHASEIHYEAGRVLFERWDSLKPEEQDFAARLLKRSMSGPGEARVLDLLESWYLSGHDAARIGRVLPDEAEALKTYARFLGERSLSLEDRQAALIRAEALEVARARAEAERSRRAADADMPSESAYRGNVALDALKSVRFYQALVGKELFAPQDYDRLLRSVRRLLAMSWVIENPSLDDPEGILAAYLEAEDDTEALGAFEKFLQERRLLGAGSGATPLRSMKALAFRMELDFKLGRYLNIAGVEGLLASSSTVLAPSGREGYVRILGLIAAASLKLNNDIEAEAFYRKAREIGPDSLDLLLGLEECYRRMGDETKAAGMREAALRLTTPKDLELGGQAVAKGQTARIDLITTGGPRAFRLHFGPSEPGTVPLVSIFLDGRVVWEKYGDTGLAEFAGTVKEGAARLEISAVNVPISLIRLETAPSEPRR